VIDTTSSCSNQPPTNVVVVLARPPDPPASDGPQLKTRWWDRGGSVDEFCNYIVWMQLSYPPFKGSVLRSEFNHHWCYQGLCGQGQSQSDCSLSSRTHHCRPHASSSL